MLPAGASQPALGRLRAAIDDSLRFPEVVEKFTGLGFEVLIKTPEEIIPFFAREAEKWPPIVRAAGLLPE